MTDTTLPPLPEPDLTSTQCDSVMRYETIHSFSETRMRAYAKSARAPLLARIAALEDRLEIYATNEKGERKRVPSYDGIECRDVTIREQDKLIAEMKTQLADAEKDARRYRWLRRSRLSPQRATFLDAATTTDLDAAIDAAMKASA